MAGIVKNLVDDLSAIFIAAFSSCAAVAIHSQWVARPGRSAQYGAAD
jgi:hypothetical protein